MEASRISTVILLAGAVQQLLKILKVEGTYDSLVKLLYSVSRDTSHDTIYFKLCIAAVFVYTEI